MSGSIYVVAMSKGRIKIGHSIAVGRRVEELRLNYGYKRCRLLGFIPGTIEQERALHRLLVPARSLSGIGREVYDRAALVALLSARASEGAGA